MKISKPFLVFILLAGISFQQCCTTDDGSMNIKKQEIMEKNAKSIPREMALVSLSIISIEESVNNLTCKALVKEIYGYGSGTRPLAPESEYNFIVENDLKEKLDFYIGKTVEAKVLQLKGGMGSKPGSNYKIIRKKN